MDVVITMLSFGKANLNNGFTQQSLINYLVQKGYNINQVNTILMLYFGGYFSYQGGGVQNINTTLYFLTPKGYFDLLQYEATFESRRQSKQANNIAVISIILSVILSVSAIVFSIYWGK